MKLVEQMGVLHSIVAIIGQIRSHKGVFLLFDGAIVVLLPWPTAGDPNPRSNLLPVSTLGLKVNNSPVLNVPLSTVILSTYAV